jgi:hypothetical protein
MHLPRILSDSGRRGLVLLSSPPEASKSAVISVERPLAACPVVQRSLSPEALAPAPSVEWPSAADLADPVQSLSAPFSFPASSGRNWPVDFDHNGEIIVWEEEDDYWEGLPLDWALEGAFGEEALTIRDAMEEDFQQEKMFARQKSKGKRELLNLHSSINYGVAKDPSRSRKGKAHMM